jgi:2-dehydro-3-deoxygluconokinase
MRRDGAIAGFGELLIRLTAPRGERILQTPRFEVAIGGAEANVLVSLSVLGHDTRMVTWLPENDLGRAAAAEIARYGVSTRHVSWGQGRMGTYFVTLGAGARASEVLYDRTGSLFATAPADAVDWSSALDGAGWLHLSGVSPAIGPLTAQAAIRAATAAKAAGLTVSFDGNFR